MTYSEEISERICSKQLHISDLHLDLGRMHLDLEKGLGKLVQLGHSEDMPVDCEGTEREVAQRKAGRSSGEAMSCGLHVDLSKILLKSSCTKRKNGDASLVPRWINRF